MATFSVPVVCSDATRTEALGPPLLAMLLSVFATSQLFIFGDSKFVVNHINGVHRSPDV